MVVLTELPETRWESAKRRRRIFTNPTKDVIGAIVIGILTFLVVIALDIREITATKIIVGVLVGVGAGVVLPRAEAAWIWLRVPRLAAEEEADRLRLDSQSVAAHSKNVAFIEESAKNLGGATVSLVAALMRQGAMRKPDMVKELSELRSYGLHHIRNEFETHSDQLPAYIDREAEWRVQVEEAMKRHGCSTDEISRVMDISNSEIGRSAVGANYGPQGNWLIGLMEMRLKRLADVIAENR